MQIIHIAAELAPIAKVGGLGDVVFGLSRQLSANGSHVRVIIPKYDCLVKAGIQDLHVDEQEVPSFYDGAWHLNTIWKGRVGTIEVYFIEPHHPSRFFHEGTLYTSGNREVERYLYFSRAVLDFIVFKKWQPDILHLHDWHTAAVAVLYEELFKKHGFNTASTLLTIHNLFYQGKAWPSALKKIGLGSEKLRDDHQPRRINLLKGGIVCANAVTTVSETYAKEVMTPQGAMGLRKTLLKYKRKFSGILNGVDYQYWNPSTDPYLAVRFSANEISENGDRPNLDRKELAKRALRKDCGLTDSDRPLVGCVTRLVHQKGVDLIQHAIIETLELGGQFVLLGSAPAPGVMDEFLKLKQKYSHNPNVAFYLKHDEQRVHRIFAGSDMIIVPSIFEPCGLTQLIALRYGSVPIVRKTGGLADTVHDVEDQGVSGRFKNGFSFSPPTNHAVDAVLKRAFKLWSQNPKAWRKLMTSGMKMDFSWKRSSESYKKLYKKITKNRKRLKIGR